MKEKISCWKDFFQWKKIFVRSVHLVLVLFIVGNLFLKNTKLHKALVLKEFVYVYSYVCLTYLSLLFYFLTCFSDPGYVPLTDKIDIEELGKRRPSSPYISLRYCEVCQIEQPIRSRHCEECKKCIKKFDHHCPWLETCIGEKNHKYFWLFLFTTDCLILWSIIITLNAIIPLQAWSEWLAANLLFLLDLHVLIISFVISFSLLIIHTYFIFTNTTTWERFSRKNITYLRKIKDSKSNPFHESYLKNIALFFCKCSTIKWESVYLKFMEKMMASGACNAENRPKESTIKLEPKEAIVSQPESSSD